jgi:quercetin dioxygenase-like cupin family protein
MLLMHLAYGIALVGAALAAPAPIIDNEHVRLLLVTNQPGVKSPLHAHTMNRVMIYLDPGQARSTDAGGRAENLQFRAGEVRWSPAGGKHTSENTAGKPYRVVEVELKTPGRPVLFGTLDPVRLAPRSYKVLIDNPQVRVLRARIEAKQSVPFHEHALNRIVVYLTDAHLRVKDESGKITEATAKVGDVRWAGVGKHSEENAAAKSFEVVAVEVK